MTPLSKLMRARMWHLRHDGGARHRLYQLSLDHRPWWDWGHRLMTLTGSNFGGNWQEPKPTTWWYRRTTAARQRFTGFPRHRPSSFQVVTDYDEFRRLTEGLDEDQMYEWQAINVSQDGELQLGHLYWGGRFHGLPADEWWLLRRYLRRAHRANWYGLRTWLYQQGLHAAVHARRPGACNAVPPKGQGGYDHWHCKLDRNHDGMHRFNNYTWGEIGGEVIGAHLSIRGG